MRQCVSAGVGTGSAVRGGVVYPGWWGRGVSGVGSRVGLEGCYTGTHQDPSQEPIFNIFQDPDPTHGQMKAFSVKLMRFPRYGLEWVLEWPQNRPRIDSESTLQDHPQTGPQMTLK